MTVVIPIKADNMHPSDKELIQKLSELTPIAYDRVRIASAKGLDVRPATLDKMVREYQKCSQKGDSAPYQAIEPWPDPISPVELLNDIAAIIRRFIVCQNETVTAVTLWIAMTWVIDEIQIAPLAIITAPEKRCGKSQLLHLLSKLVNRPIVASNITPAALFRTIDLWKPTLLIDEVDTFLRDNEELRGLINCGHTRDSAYIIRVVGEELTPKVFFAWGAKALAGIGKLPDTIMDRAITLPLRRKLPEENIERLRHADPEIFTRLSSRLARFALDYAEQIHANKPELPSALHDRAQDNWEPLLAIAATTSNEWAVSAQHAALLLSQNTDQSLSLGVELLIDIQAIIDKIQSDRITTADLIASLSKDTEKRWSTYNSGRPISPRQVANHLRQFGIVSNTIRIGAITAKGYMFLQFADAFSRYIPQSLDSDVTPSQANKDNK